MRLPLQNSIAVTAVAIVLGLFASATSGQGHAEGEPCLFGLLKQRAPQEVSMLTAPDRIVETALPATRL
jgi:hypothetical protein